MLPKTIEGSYLDYMAMMKEVQQHNLELTFKGHRVFKNTWLCAAAYFWNRMKHVILIDTDEARNVMVSQIRDEIENCKESEKFQVFHTMCFPDTPVGLLATTWTCSGRAVRDIGTPILSLPPSKKRTMLIKGLDTELYKLRVVWIVPVGDPGNN